MGFGNLSRKSLAVQTGTLGRLTDDHPESVVSD